MFFKNDNPFSNASLSLENSLEDIKIPVDLSLFSEEAEILEYWRNLKGDDNWSQARSNENFRLIEKVYPFGTRRVYEPIDHKNNLDLQSSRGLGFNGDEDIEKMVKSYIRKTSLFHESDKLRFDEASLVVEKITEQLEDFLSQNNDPVAAKAVKIAVARGKDKFVEIGARTANFLNHYKNNGWTKVIGYDINPISVGIAKKLGWDLRLGDIKDASGFDLKDSGLVVLYHVLEHVSDPLKSLKTLNTAAGIGTKFHIEIPIEPGIPRLRYGHLFPFESGDLVEMLKLAGFIPVSFSNIPHPGGPAIERVVAVSTGV